VRYRIPREEADGKDKAVMKARRVEGGC